MPVCCLPKPNYSTVRILLCVASLGILIEEVVRIILRILCVASLGIIEKKCCDHTGLNFLFIICDFTWGHYSTYFMCGFIGNNRERIGVTSLV